MRFIAVIVTVLGCLSTSACSYLYLPQPTVEVVETPTPEVLCPIFERDSALTVCTMKFMPVCGETINREWRTYSNACDACASGATRHLPNACEMYNEGDNEYGQ